MITLKTQHVICASCNTVTQRLIFDNTCGDCGGEAEVVNKVSEHVFEELGTRCCFGGGHHRYAFVVDGDGEVFAHVKACEVKG